MREMENQEQKDYDRKWAITIGFICFIGGLGGVKAFIIHDAFYLFFFASFLGFYRLKYINSKFKYLAILGIIGIIIAILGTLKIIVV